MRRIALLILGAATAVVWLVFCLAAAGVFVVYMGGDFDSSPTSTDRAYRECAVTAKNDAVAVYNEIGLALSLANSELDMDILCMEIPRWSRRLLVARSNHYGCPSPENEHLRSARIHNLLFLTALGLALDSFEQYCDSPAIGPGDSRYFHEDVDALEEAVDWTGQAEAWGNEAKHALDLYDESE